MDINVESVITSSWRSPVNMSRNKEEYYNILDSDILLKLPTSLPARMSKSITDPFFQLILGHLVPL